MENNNEDQNEPMDTTEPLMTPNEVWTLSERLVTVKESDIPLYLQSLRNYYAVTTIRLLPPEHTYYPLRN